MSTFIATLSLAALLLSDFSEASCAPSDEDEWVGKQAPELSTGDWLNSPPLSLKQLKGRVVLIEFWTYGCYNCLNTLPHIKAWNKKYAGKDFSIVGVHTPEFAREKNLGLVKQEVERLGIRYPVVTDNDYATWDRYHQRYWPVVYLMDREGIIRYVHIGEGNYGETEAEINTLLAER